MIPSKPQRRSPFRVAAEHCSCGGTITGSTATPVRRSKARTRRNACAPRAIAEDSIAQLTELSPVVLVAVDRERDLAGALAQRPQRRRVGEPAVERDRGQGGVVAVGAGVTAEGAELDEAIGRPVQVGVVEEEAGPRRRRSPGGRRQ